MHGFFEPSVKKKVDYVSAQFDGWKALFRSADNLLETLAAAAGGGAGEDTQISKLIAQTRRECDDERRALETTFDKAVLQIEAGANVEDTPPMAGSLACDFKALTKLAAGKMPQLLRQSQAARLPNMLHNGDLQSIGLRPFSNASNSNSTTALFIDVGDRAQSSIGMVGSDSHQLNGGGSDAETMTPNAASMSYAAAVQRPPSAPVTSSTTQVPSMEICYQRLRDAVKRPDHYNLLENTPTTRYFIARPLSPVDVLASIYHSAWSASSPQCNQRLTEAYEMAKMNHSNVYLFFSFAGTEEFCGVAQMMSPVEKVRDDSWVPSHARNFARKARFYVEWLYVKDLPFCRFKIREQAFTPERRPALVKEAPDVTEIVSNIENRLVGRRLIHSYHDLCSQGASLLADRERFSQMWPQLRRLIGPIVVGTGATLGSSKLTAVDDVYSESDLTCNDHPDLGSAGSHNRDEGSNSGEFSTSANDWPPVELTSTLSPCSPFPECTSLPVTDGANVRYFICRPAVGQDVVASVERGIWAAGTIGGHGRLHKAYTTLRAKYQHSGHIYLFFSIWSTDRFCGVAEMISSVNFSATPFWLPSFPERRPEIAGEFQVKWLNICDIPFSAFTGRLFSLSSCKGQLTDLAACRDCDELLNVSDGVCLLAAFSNAHSAKSSLPKTTALPEGQSTPNLSVSTPPPSPFEANGVIDIERLTLANNGGTTRTKAHSETGDHPALYSQAHLPTTVLASTSLKPQLEKVKIGESVNMQPVLSRQSSNKSDSSSAPPVTFVCGVCYTRGPAKPINLPCGHICHEACYTEWLKRNAPATCPRCRMREKPHRKPLNLFGPRF